jgi:hypothetical protein
MIQVQEDSYHFFCSLKTLTKKGPVYKIKFRYGAFAENKMSGEFSDIEQNPEDFAADIISQVLDDCFETLSLKSDIEHQESIRSVDTLEMLRKKKWSMIWKLTSLPKL